MAGIAKICDDGLASLCELVLHASGVELQHLAHEKETSADESASSAREEEASPPKDPISIGAAGSTPPSEPRWSSAPASSSTAPLPTASAVSLAAVVSASIQRRDVKTSSRSDEKFGGAALPICWLDDHWERQQ